MANYHSIKAKEQETTKSFSAKKFHWYLKGHKILLALYSELFFWGISWIPFLIFPFLFGLPQAFYIFYVIAHFIMWEVTLKKKYHKECDNDIIELELTIQVLMDIKKERLAAKGEFSGSLPKNYDEV